MPICISCSEETNKYKCPTCRGYYCSLACCKKHKETPCQSPPTPKEIFVEDTTRHLDLFTTVDTVDPELLERLRDCEPLKKLLYNPHLRNYLQEIDISKNASRAMTAAMLEPLFLEFADECLKVVEPRKPEDEDLLM